MIEPYPDYVCQDCAEKGGGSMPDGHLATWHMNECPCCLQFKPVTQPRDFRYPKLRMEKGDKENTIQ